MDQFERELKARLARHEPSADLSARVMAAVCAEPRAETAAPVVFSPPKETRRPLLFRWATVGAMAASLTVGVLAVRHQRAERRAAELAEMQLMESLSVAGAKVSQARDKVWGAPRGD